MLTGAVTRYKKDSRREMSLNICSSDLFGTDAVVRSEGVAQILGEDERRRKQLVSAYCP